MLRPGLVLGILVSPRLIGPAFAAWMVGFAPWTVVMLVLAVAGVPLVPGLLVAYPRAASRAGIKVS